MKKSEMVSKAKADLRMIKNCKRSLYVLFGLAAVFLIISILAVETIQPKNYEVHVYWAATSGIAAGVSLLVSFGFLGRLAFIDGFQYKDAQMAHQIVNEA